MNRQRTISSAILALSAALALTPAGAQDTATEMEPTSDRKQVVLYGEPVDRVYAPNIHSWQAIDSQRLVLYVTAFRPYLVTLNRKVNALNWEHRIAIDNRTSHIDARFDRVFVDGFPYRIERIEKLSRETARTLLGRGRDKDEDAPGEAGEEAEQESLPEPEQEGS